MRDFCPRLKMAVYNALRELIPEKSLPQYFRHWKNSAACTRVNQALALVKSHHPDVNIGVVTSGIPERRADGTEFTKAEFNTLRNSLCGYSTRLARTLKVDRFFSEYDMEGQLIKATFTQKTHGAPSTSTPEVPEVTRMTKEKGEPSKKAT
jgi:hypothetical protein